MNVDYAGNDQVVRNVVFHQTMQVIAERSDLALVKGNVHNGIEIAVEIDNPPLPQYYVEGRAQAPPRS